MNTFQLWQATNIPVLPPRQALTAVSRGPIRYMHPTGAPVIHLWIFKINWSNARFSAIQSQIEILTPMISKSTASPAQWLLVSRLPKRRLSRDIENHCSAQSAHRNVGAWAPGQNGISAAMRQFDRHLVDCRWHGASQVASDHLVKIEMVGQAHGESIRRACPTCMNGEKAKLCGAVRPRR